MSNIALSWAFKCHVGNASAKAVLVYLADRADDDGTAAYPKIATIVNITELSERTVRTALKTLQERGFIRRGDQRNARLGKGGRNRLPQYCQKDPLHAVVLGGVFTPYGPLLTDDYGRPIRFAEYGDGPCRFGDHPIQVMKPYEWLADRVYVFDDEAVAPFKDDVARFVVEACRCFVGGDGDHDRSVVLCREGVAEQLDLSSDAFTPMVGSDGNAVSFSYQPCDRLRCVCSTNPQKGLGVFHVWTERGTTYQAVLGPCAYERRPEKALTLPDELWSRNESWMRDFFEQETSDFLCLGVVSRRTNIRFVEGGGARG